MKKKHVFRGDIYGNDTSYGAGAEHFAFDLTPYTWGKLTSLRQALLAGDRDYGLDLCSVTTLASDLRCDIYAGRRSSPCQHVELLELVVMPECFYWQFSLGDRTVYQTEDIPFSYAERIAKGWNDDEA